MATNIGGGEQDGDSKALDTITIPEEQPMGMRCCGRPMISNGMLDKAIRYAEFNVDSLLPWAKSGKPILACEPSCILTIKDDYPALLKGEYREKARVVAERCFTFEEILESQLANLTNALTPSPSPKGRGEPVFREGPRRILVQPHCHQRSLVGTSALIKLLAHPRRRGDRSRCRLLRHGRVVRYEKEHYEISRWSANALFPAIRQADADTVIVALASRAGCRSSISRAASGASGFASAISTGRPT